MTWDVRKKAKAAKRGIDMATSNLKQLLDALPALRECGVARVTVGDITIEFYDDDECDDSLVIPYAYTDPTVPIQNLSTVKKYDTVEIEPSIVDTERPRQGVDGMNNDNRHQSEVLRSLDLAHIDD